MKFGKNMTKLNFELIDSPIWLSVIKKPDIFYNCVFTSWSFPAYDKNNGLWSPSVFDELIIVMDRILSTGKKIVFDLVNECYQKNYVDMMIKLTKCLIENHGHSIDDFIYISGSLPTDQNFEKYRSIRNVYLPKLILVNTFETQYSDEYWKPNNRFFDSKKPKIFVSMNGGPRSHRIALTILLGKMGLIQNSSYSIKPYCHSDLAIVFHKFLDKVDYNLNSGLKLSVDFENDYPHRSDRIREEDAFYFDNSYFSLVQETLFCEKDIDIEYEHYDCQFITEKTFRPMIYRHPFILSGKYQALAALQEYGYKTFHPFIDESYDNIKDDCDRLEAIANEVKRLCNLSHDEWSAIYKQISHILDFNYEKLSSSKLTFKVQNETIS